ncbi:MAG: hypothetical protein KIPDCIKN_03614 [Haliscomenobacter sp.]|jgi:hypothetical protein|nr:hypothetical protein [Haliscomenobacter sp.]
MERRITTYLSFFLILALGFVSCQVENLNPDEVVSQEVINQVYRLGFNPDGIVKVEEGYRVERDIILTEELLNSTPTDHRVPNMEQYRTTNLVNAGTGRVITVYIPQGGSKGFSATYVSALDEAISRYNAESLLLTFQRVTSSTGASIKFTRLGRLQELQGVLGSAGFPSNGNPYNQIKMSGVLESSYGLGVNGIATIMAHEMGHCIGFRHTDYFDRSISCGGSTSNEGAGSAGAVHIPGTPTGATLAAKSWMLACTDGGDRPFNTDDRTALDYLY